MSKKIFISCSPSGIGLGSNFGMQTVDFAIWNIAKEVRKPDKVILTAPWPAYDKTFKERTIIERNNFPTRINYGLNNLDNLNNDNILFFWGDFQWGNDYQEQSKLRLLKNVFKGVVPNGLNIDSLIKNRFLLSSFYSKNVLPFKIFSYGTTLFQNRLTDLLDQEYSGNLHWLIKNSNYVKFRDSYSANYCAEIKKDFSSNYLGVDAALLNKATELLSLEIGDTSFIESFQGQIGYYFGRSSGSFPKLKVAQFMKQLGQRFSKKYVRIPWTYFSSGLFTDSMDNFMKFMRVPIVKTELSKITSGDILKGISNCDFVITDTYHVAINCIALKVPVFIIPEFITKVERNANMGYIESWRDKRYLLFQNNSLSDLMIIPNLLNNKNYKNKKTEIFKLLIENTETLNLLYNPLIKRAMNDREEIINLLNDFIV